MNTDARAMNPADTTLAPTLCCYEGCDRVAVTTDADGDDCCVECAAKAERWVIVTDLSESARWCDAELAEKLKEAMSELGYDVEIRESGRGRAEGTYMYRDDGSYMQAKYDPRNGVVEYFEHVLNRAWNKLI